MMKKKKSDLLTAVELEFMSELWAIEEGTVRDVLARLPESRNLAYTSAATILRILEQKEFVTSRKEGKSHVYIPTLARDTYQSRSLKDLSAKLFDDTPASLVARLVNDDELTEEALGQIRALVDRRLKNDSG
ncbi:BlaI/MecI/CopY family transcriptional regulator [Phaeobacter gallaeciensis]|uniref:BlaI/MecI/CopY family transcriptional regulator n=3 Tax=Rhodobacterales TaxID=204455 RepID=A0A366WZB8_9RHOB|nr:BlaI/MecI/CopY family transcriptional regulator [Phaeobacter gallaeciensis]MBT3143755.1 BlaI/MecI/CopY family transcriptional regulator [Falsiruegeria litorea]MBT8169580.1 BlaI/MecI/CopY family transcriptional regulator [Falsiruegeria litorea]RBW53512.1 BlaI/MecI/CopY family transcriptional regulator [Phaeobacter gallaeciensis]